MNRGELLKALEALQKGDWRAAHEIVQRDEDSAAACWAHGIVHLMEGDASNARYWYKKAARPFSADIPKEIAALSESLRN